MATTTPNYGWSVPTSSDLVKNGATAIETLGDSVDASLWSSGYGQAGKNKIINGDFAINQRNFTSITTNTTFGFDRWFLRTGGTGGTTTYTPQIFTAGAAPVAGYEAANYARFVTSGFSSTDAIVGLRQNIEDVRTFAGQTITVSFWAKAATGTPNIGVQWTQQFGSGGSAVVSILGGLSAITTSWVRYSFTVAIPSISGKTIGTGSALLLSIYGAVGSSIAGYGVDIPAVGTQNNTFDIWGVQVEYGAKMTPFQTASGGSPQAELAMCQRYYYRATATNGAYGTLSGVGIAQSTTVAQIPLSLPVPLRASPTSIDYSTIRILDGTNGYAVTSVANTFAGDNQFAPNLSFTVASGLTQWRGYYVSGNNSSAAYIGLSAEL